MKVEIVVAGHVCLDLTPALPATGARNLGELLVAGTLVEVGPCVISAGGAVANTGVALRRLGVSAVLMGKAGDDELGELLANVLSDAGCTDAVRRVPGEHTSYTIVLAPPGIDRVFLHNPGANATYTAGDVDYEVVQQARLFHFGYPPLMPAMIAQNGEELVRMFQRARAMGAVTSLDMALPDVHAAAGQLDWECLLQRVLPHVDIFLPSVEEILLCLDRPAYLRKRAQARDGGGAVVDYITVAEYSHLGQRLLDMGAGVVVLKCGARGIYLRSGEAPRLHRLIEVLGVPGAAWAQREMWQPAFFVEQVASATGAGDCAVAAFLAALLRTASAEEALAMANAAGALNVQTYDATSGIKPYAEIRRMLPKWPRCAVEMNAESWRYDAAQQTWYGPRDRR